MRSLVEQGQGSSPPARGAHQVHPGPLGDPRIIPACAGSTRCPRREVRASSDHPRLRGEHPGSQPEIGPEQGSSPPARGALRAQILHAHGQRIVPACAGSTSDPIPGATQREDHPRLRGEHVTLIHQKFLNKGSSPPARGARRKRVSRARSRGIIPACAGSTYPKWARRRASNWIIPACAGSTENSYTSSSRNSGSSPPARGAHDHADPTGRRYRIIPACAGSTGMTGRRSHCLWDHPRLRGEHADWTFDDSDQPGSSPPARGAPLRMA